MSENGEKNPSEITWQFLEYLARFRFMSGNQVKALWEFPDERLEALVASGWVVRFEIHDPAGESAPRQIFALGRLGAVALATRSSREPRHYPYLTPGKLRLSLMFLEHTLARNEFALVLEKACASRDDTQLLFWEHRTERLTDVVHLAGKRGEYERQPLCADGFFGLRIASRPVGRNEVYFLVEIDRGTVTLPRMVKRYQGYLRWCKEGGPQRRFGIPNLRVLTVAKGERRLARLRGAAAGILDNPSSGLFLFAEEAEITIGQPADIFRPIWLSSNRVEKHSLLD